MRNNELPWTTEDVRKWAQEIVNEWKLENQRVIEDARKEITFDNFMEGE